MLSRAVHRAGQHDEGGPDAPLCSCEGGLYVGDAGGRA